MTKLYYSVGVDMAEVTIASMDFYRIAHDTEAVVTLTGSDEDPKLYVLYKDLDHRDAAYEAFRDRFRTAKRIYSPHQLEEEDINADHQDSRSD